MTDVPPAPFVVVRREQAGPHAGLDRHSLWCPGCAGVHEVVVGGANGWSWNGSLEAPGYEPSILVTMDFHESSGLSQRRCHSFLRDGVWQFLEDSTHGLAGRTMPVEPVPEWLLSGGAR